jgi:hypothetical protein
MEPEDAEDLTKEITSAISSAASRIARAITADAAPGPDANGGLVDSLTEAVMGTTASLARIADALESVADAIKGRG